MKSKAKYCTPYLKGNCTKGDDCPIAHLEQVAVDAIMKADRAAKAKKEARSSTPGAGGR